MPLFNWESEYAIGHSEIDKQHQRIIAIMNRLYELLSKESQDLDKHADQIIDELATHVTTHFAYEEDLMVRVGYPTEKIAEHVVAHNALLAEVQTIVSAHREGDAKALADLMPFLYGKWLIDHIGEKDKDYSSYVLASQESET